MRMRPRFNERELLLSSAFQKDATQIFRIAKNLSRIFFSLTHPQNSG
jgi:hypothetical protein